MNAAASKRLLTVLFTGVLLCAGATLAAAEPVCYTIEIEVDPAKSAGFLANTDAAKDTRAFDGCDRFADLGDENNPVRVSFCEIRESKEHHQAYQSWRGETSFEATIAPFMTGDSVRTCYIRFEA